MISLCQNLEISNAYAAHFVETHVRPGREYCYRIIAKSYDDTTLRPGQPTQIRL